MDSTQTWVPSDGRGQASELVTITLPSGGPTGNVNPLAAGDLDGDGGTDVLVNSGATTLVEGLYVTAGKAGFDSFVKTLGPSAPTVGGQAFRGFGEAYYPSSVVVADFDRNGLPDLAGVFGALNNRWAAVQRQSSAGQWQTPVYVLGQSGVAPTNTLCVEAGDLNNDGKPDLVAGGRSFGIQTFLGDGAGDFVAQSPTPACVGTACPYRLQLVDFDRDGNQDVLVVGNNFPSGSDPAFVGVMMGDGIGRFASLKTLYSAPPSLGVAYAFAGDIDGNGRPDIVFSHSAGTGIVANTPTGFAAPQIVTLPGGVLGMNDINGDGKSDLVVLRVSPTSPSSPPGVGWLLSR